MMSSSSGTESARSFANLVRDEQKTLKLLQVLQSRDRAKEGSVVSVEMQSFLSECKGMHMLPGLVSSLLAAQTHPFTTTRAQNQQMPGEASTKQAEDKNEVKKEKGKENGADKQDKQQVLTLGGLPIKTAKKSNQKQEKKRVRLTPTSITPVTTAGMRVDGEIVTGNIISLPNSSYEREKLPPKPPSFLSIARIKEDDQIGKGKGNIGGSRTSGTTTIGFGNSSSSDSTVVTGNGFAKKDNSSVPAAAAAFTRTLGLGLGLGLSQSGVQSSDNNYNNNTKDKEKKALQAGNSSSSVWTGYEVVLVPTSSSSVGSKSKSKEKPDSKAEGAKGASSSSSSTTRGAFITDSESLNSAHRLGSIFAALVQQQMIPLVQALALLSKLLSVPCSPQGYTLVLKTHWEELNSEYTIMENAEYKNPNENPNNNKASEKATTAMLLPTLNLVHEFAVQSLRSLSGFVRVLGAGFAEALSDAPALRAYDLQLAEEYRSIAVDAPGDDHCTLPEVFIRPFREETDSRLEYKTQIETAMYNERERCFDEFSNLLHMFQEANRSDISGVKVQEVFKKLPILGARVLNLKDCNFLWFADIFTKMLLFHGPNGNMHTRISNGAPRQAQAQASAKPMRRQSDGGSPMKIKITTVPKEEGGGISTAIVVDTSTTNTDNLDKCNKGNGGAASVSNPVFSPPIRYSSSGSSATGLTLDQSIGTKEGAKESSEEKGSKHAAASGDKTAGGVAINGTTFYGSKNAPSAVKQRKLEERLGVGGHVGTAVPTRTLHGKDKAFTGSGRASNDSGGDIYEEPSMHFPGTQHFFFRFIVLMDNHRFSQALQANLCNEIMNIVQGSGQGVSKATSDINRRSSANMNEKKSPNSASGGSASPVSPSERFVPPGTNVSMSEPYTVRVLKLKILGRFLGVLHFWPNWTISIGKPLEKRTGSSTNSETRGPLSLLAEEGAKKRMSMKAVLPIKELILAAWADKNLCLVVPWVTEFLKMATWEHAVRAHNPYSSSLSLLKGIQYSDLFSANKGYLTSNRLHVLVEIQSLWAQLPGTSPGARSYYSSGSVPVVAVIKVPRGGDGLGLGLDEQTQAFSRTFNHHVADYLEEIVSLAKTKARRSKGSMQNTNNDKGASSQRNLSQRKGEASTRHRVTPTVVTSTAALSIVHAPKSDPSIAREIPGSNSSVNSDVSRLSTTSGFQSPSFSKGGSGIGRGAIPRKLAFGSALNSPSMKRSNSGKFTPSAAPVSLSRTLSLNSGTVSYVIVRGL